jgi:hypothetical protein
MVSLFRMMTVFVLATILVVAGASLAEPTAPEKTDADIVAKVRKAAETAEVHGIGLGQPMHHRLEDLKDWPGFVATLREQREKKGPAGRVWEFLSKETQKKVLDDKNVALLNDPNPSTSVQSTIKASVASDLRKMIDNPDFYTAEAFKDIPLAKEFKDLVALGKKRTVFQTTALNWTLLRKAFPDNVPEIPERFRTVRVQVLSGKDVVLVLSCYRECRWEVTLREGAKVTGIVLCGYHSQEVVGVNAPMIYRCYYGPDGVTVPNKEDYFYGYDEKAFAFKKFLASVKGITGKDFTKFTGKNHPVAGDEPFIVFPSAK